MAKHNDRLRVLRETNRVEAFSDGVFAIAATLLVADLKVPVGIMVPGAIGLWQAILANWPGYLAFALSFMIVVIFWGNHHQMLKHIRYTDPMVLVLNGFILLGIAFVPHVTALLAHYLLDPGRATVATAMYAGTLCAVSLAINLFWDYAARHPDLLDETADSPAVQFHTQQYRLSLGLRVLTVLLAFASVPVCLVMLVMVSLYYLIPRG